MDVLSDIFAGKKKKKEKEKEKRRVEALRTKLFPNFSNTSGFTFLTIKQGMEYLFRS